MGTKVGLTGITFGDASVQNTAAVTGVTSLTAGSGISLSGSTGAVTVSASGGGTVTSVATGNGLQGGTITSSGTLSIAAPSFNTVGNSIFGNTNHYPNNGGVAFNSGGDYSAGSGQGQLRSFTIGTTNTGVNNLSGTWRWMGAPFNVGTFGGCCSRTYQAVICRVS
jgi:hypothetical protein